MRLNLIQTCIDLIRRLDAREQWCYERMLKFGCYYYYRAEKQNKNVE